MTQEIEKQLSVPDPKHEYRDVPVTNTNGQARDRHIVVNSNRIRILQEAWRKRWNRFPNQTPVCQNK